VLFNELTQKVSHFKNVKLISGFLSNEEIPLKHLQNGVFLCPTRQDAQGVSMCEAMSSGLVPVTSNNTAIPEFVEDKYSGFLNVNTPVKFADSIEFIFNNPKRFLKISKNASIAITNKCSSSLVSKLELDLFT
jgi:glycosyltransferase involved in cell wall biosynthesis